MFLDAFDNYSQQDAHEFLNYLLNTCADLLTAEMKELKELQRIEDSNLGARLNLKSYRALHASSKSNVNNGASKNSSSSGKRNSSVTGSNRSLSSQNSSNSKVNGTGGERESQANCSGIGPDPGELTWIHELFQGILVNETKCLNCETVSLYSCSKIL